MRTNARRGAHALTMVVLTAAVSLSGRVEAQQTGLFPLAPIRRQRVPCDQEDPTYKIYKHQYFGYHPTCWHPFPPGWGCPSSEAPNRERSLQEIKPGYAGAEESAEMPPEEPGPGAPPPRRGQGVPELPQERSPFEELPGNVPNANPLPRGNTAPRPAPGREPDPFQELNPRGASTSPSRGRSPERVAPAAPDDAAPELAAPGEPPARASASRSERREVEGEELTAEERAPLGLADGDIVRSEARSADDSAEVPAAIAAPGDAAAAPAPATTPRRRIFGNLFSALGSSRTRR